MMTQIWNHFGFVFPVFAGLLIYGARVKKRKYFWIRFPLSFLAVFFIMFFGMDPVVGFFVGLGCNPYQVMAVRVSFAFMVYALSFLSCLLCYQVDFFLGLYVITCAYTTQHFARTVVNIIELYIATTPAYLDALLCLAAWALVYPLAYYLFVHKLRNKELSVSNKFQLIIATIPILFCIFFNSFGSLAIETTFGKLILDLFILCTAILGLFLEYLMTLGKDMEQEKTQMRKMMKEQKEQYLFEKQLIDLVNIKAHDLKHQLNGDMEVSRDYQEKTKKLIGEYDASFETGVSSIDIILTKKSRECNRHGIELTCMIDPKCLSFIEDIDVYSLFGNIIDNAIEACRKIENKQRRVISVSTRESNGFVEISESNYFEGEITFKDGIPQTSKGNTDYHGYGFKSIRSICEKYEGSLKVETNNNIFNLNIVIPVSPSSNQK